MKKIMFLIFLLFAIPALADTITLQWDAAPAGQNWTAVRIYEVAGTVYTLQTSVAGSVTTASFTVDKLGHSYIARAYDGIRESGDSNTVILPAAPLAPGHLSFIVKAMIGFGAGIAALFIWLLAKKK
jgi:hypothetical protein